MHTPFRRVSFATRLPLHNFLLLFPLVHSFLSPSPHEVSGNKLSVKAASPGSFLSPAAGANLPSRHDVDGLVGEKWGCMVVGGLGRLLSFVKPSCFHGIFDGRLHCYRVRCPVVRIRLCLLSQVDGHTACSRASLLLHLSSLRDQSRASEEKMVCSFYGLSPRAFVRGYCANLAQVTVQPHHPRS